MIIDRRTRYFFYHSGEISRRNIQFICIKSDLSLTLEIAIQQMQKDFVYILFMAQVSGRQKAVIRQLRNQKFQDIHHRLNHLYLINMLMAHNIPNHMNDIKSRLEFIVRKMINQIIRNLFINKNTFSLEIFRYFGKLINMLRRYDKQITCRKLMFLILSTFSSQDDFKLHTSAFYQ